MFDALKMGLFNTATFLPPIADYNFKITGLKLREQDMNGTPNLVLDIYTRIEGNDPETGGKPVTCQCILGPLSSDKMDFATNDDGVPQVNFSQVARVFHAAFGYGNTKAEDQRFAEEREGLDLSIDIENQKLTGAGWDELKGCSIAATIGHRKGKREDQFFSMFNAIRPVSN